MVFSRMFRMSRLLNSLTDWLLELTNGLSASLLFVLEPLLAMDLLWLTGPEMS
jgi:hypothetical protein